MFPNPQAALPLPTKPNVERYKKLAKTLLKACKAHKSGDTKAISNWVEKWIESLARLIASKKDLGRNQSALDRTINEVEEFAIRKLGSIEGRCLLTEAQFVIACSHGFESWPKFVKHLNGLAKKTTSIARFEAAADAIVTGDLKTLKRLLREDPKLVRTRSTREHRATLLHYVSANGVEGYRQRTPKNAVKIAETLLNAGAEVDAEADVYGGGATTLGLVATSVHPFRAGVQNPVMQVLLNHGAQIDRPESAGNKQSAVLGCLANGRGEAAVYLAERGARLSLEGAAGVGRLDVIEKAFNENGSLKTSVSRKELERAFLYAASWGRNNVLEFLLKKGIGLKTHGGDGQTAMHCAAICGHLDTIKLLLKLRPPLEARNVYGGTVLGQTLWSAAHGGDPKKYSEIIQTLIAAGAKVPERHVPVNEQIDDLLRRYGSLPEPTWYWFGEKPRRKG
jgi:ankyrin repeat protein